MSAQKLGHKDRMPRTMKYARKFKCRGGASASEKNIHKVYMLLRRVASARTEKSEEHPRNDLNMSIPSRRSTDPRLCRPAEFFSPLDLSIAHTLIKRCRDRSPPHSCQVFRACSRSLPAASRTFQASSNQTLLAWCGTTTSISKILFERPGYNSSKNSCAMPRTILSTAGPSMWKRSSSGLWFGKRG